MINQIQAQQQKDPVQRRERSSEASQWGFESRRTSRILEQDRRRLDDDGERSDGKANEREFFALTHGLLFVFALNDKS